MIDYSLDPVTYLFGAAGVGLVNFVRYFGGTKLVQPYLALKNITLKVLMISLRKFTKEKMVHVN